MNLRVNRYTVALVMVGIAGVSAFQNCGQFQAMQFDGKLSSSTDGPGGDPHGGHDDHTHTLTIPMPSTGAATQVTEGDFVTLQAGKDLGLKITGRAVMVRRADGKTRVDVTALGLPPNAHLPAHVHNAACATGGGGHYLIDTTVTTALAANEIWPNVTSDTSGFGYGSAEVSHVARADAMSVVIHGGPSNAKLACVDLKPAGPSAKMAGGNFLPLAGGDAPMLTGRAIMAVLDNGQTEIRVAAKGLLPSTMYPAHLHVMDCASGQGGHYKIDTLVATVVETNELWPTIATNAMGIGVGVVRVDHTVRAAEAKSVVIHTSAGVKIGCADLVPDTSGVLAFDKALERNRNIAGTGSIERLASGDTVFKLAATGLEATKTYVSHVHNRPCSVGAAGGHYKIDDKVATVVETNEIFLRITAAADGTGTATVTVPHTARPDAAAIVIHDPMDSAKLACVDLLNAADPHAGHGGGGMMTGGPVIPAPSTTAITQITEGDIITLQAGKDLGLKISGRALMLRKADGKTRVDVTALGLGPEMSYAAHVHNMPCAVGAGTHYLIDPAITTAVETNEIWPAVTTDKDGYGYGSKEVMHVARADAMSVVIHGGPANAKIACADLKSPQSASEVLLGGPFAPLGTEVPMLAGSALLTVRDSGHTEITVSAKGLLPATTYPAHLHVMTCAQGQGGHYKIDPTIAATVETNEIWPSFMTNTAGIGLGTIRVAHSVRLPEAKSVVIHSPAGVKIGCADLVTSPSTVVLFDKALERNRMIIGTAQLSRQNGGTSTLLVNISSGLEAGKTYVSHVHNRPCTVNSGGGHYKIDEKVTTTVEMNEIFIRITATSFGGGVVPVNVPHTLRPDATSIVIHDPADSAKLACMDLL